MPGPAPKKNGRSRLSAAPVIVPAEHGEGEWATGAEITPKAPFGSSNWLELEANWPVLPTEKANQVVYHTTGPRHPASAGQKPREIRTLGGRSNTWPGTGNGQERYH